MSRPDEHLTADTADAYLHDLLSSDEKARVDLDCAECETCRAILEQALKRLAGLTALPAHEPSEQLIQSTLKAVEERESRLRRLRRRVFLAMGLATAAAVLILSGFHVYYLNLAPTPSDLRVYGQTELLAATPASLRVRLMDRHTGRPMPDVPVTIRLRDAKQDRDEELVSFTTDADGTGQPRFDLPDWPAGNYELSVTARTRGTPEVITHRVTLRRPAKVMLTSDKPVYQPGQTIRVRALGLRRPTLRPLGEQEATFLIRDPKANVIFKQRLKTSKYGIAAIDCPLASEVNEGGYTIACTVSDTESTLTVDVKKYVLPKFKIALKTDRPFYQPRDRVRIDVEARYVFGKPAAKATVEVSAKSLDGSVTLYPKTKSQTDAEGKVRIEFPVPEDITIRDEHHGLPFVVNLMLTDTADQKQEASASSVVTRKPLRIEIIPESGTLVQSIANRVYLYASHMDGTPARVTLTIAELRKTLETSDLGVAELEVTPKAWELTLSVRARDSAGLAGWRSVKLTCGQPGHDFVLRTDRAVYDGGDTMHLEILGGGKEPVFLDVLRDGQTVLTRTLDLKDGRRRLDLDLPPEWFGALQLCAYRIGTEGLAIRKYRVFYVRQTDNVRVQAKQDRKEYRPGGQARVDLTLTDKHGKPSPGALSVAAVDEAVFQVNTGRLEETFSLLEQELLRPVYEVYPWSPELKVSVPDERKRNVLEQTLFANTVVTTETGRPDKRHQRFDRTHPPGSTHSLDVATFGPKILHTTAAREEGLRWVARSWAFLVVCVALAGYLLLWSVCKGDTLALVHVLGFSVLLPLLFVLASRTREEAPHRTVADESPSESVNIRVLREPPVDFQTLPPPEQALTYLPQSLSAAVGIAGRLKDGTTRLVPRQSPRLRQWFPETILWRPELITDDKGRYTLEFPLADSITTWRLSASAVTLDGRLGAARQDLRVFQPFFVDLDLPVSLTRKDEVALRVVVHNHADKAQSVQLALKRDDWFDLLDGTDQRLDVGAMQVRSVAYRIRAKKVGTHRLDVTATAGDFSDRIRKEIEIVPEGQRVETAHSGFLREPASVTLTLPKDAIEGSAKAFVKIYPSTFSQLVEGLDSIFRMPYGCFEQTSSTTYPNVLALDYLKRTGKSNAKVEEKARHYIHLGYQRLLTFEVPGGGFDWYGRPPANVVLSAYGLMEFRDLAKVHDLDTRLVERTRQWLLSRRAPDGSWGGAGGHFVGSAYATTAYVAWSVFADEASRDEAGRTLDFLLSERPEAIRDPYVLALTCNALLALDRKGDSAAPYLNRLESLRKSDGKRVWWELDERGQTLFYGAGPSGSVETTALAVLALVEAKRSPTLTSAALSWLVAQKDPRGTWHSTQATVLALKALLAGTRQNAGERERLVRVRFGNFRRDLRIPADQAEVVQQVDLSGHLRPGEQTVRLDEPTETESAYQVTFRYHIPTTTAPEKKGLSVAMEYDRKQTTVGETIKATATVRNGLASEVSMVMLELPVPAGFALERDDLDAPLRESKIDKFELTQRGAIIYLRSVRPGEPFQLTYRLRATTAAKVTVPGARVYAYYDPHNEGLTSGAHLTAGPGQ
ncbi:MAG: hypothetical protein HYS12_19980 [Planctomycetes bacterium]|nr:hypothetical protein [Planctomycetota bacterium]